MPTDARAGLDEFGGTRTDAFSYCQRLRIENWHLVSILAFVVRRAPTRVYVNLQLAIDPIVPLLRYTKWASKEAAMQPYFQEKRRVRRSRVFLGGEIFIGQERRPVECHIKNISECGANITALSGEMIPAQI